MNQKRDFDPLALQALYICQANPILNSVLLPFINERFPFLQFKGPENYFEEVLALFDRRPQQSFAHYMAEAAADGPLKAQYEEVLASGRIPRKYANYAERFTHAIATTLVTHYYAIVRELKPTWVLETGTATGSATSFILAALHRNGHGRLISVDLAPKVGELTMDLTLSQQDVGLLIPPAYRDRWDLQVGDAKLLLPKIMAEYPIDMFIHDSLHTRTHMAFEYAVARALMQPGGIIVSDDILWNRSFDKFCDTHELKALACTANPNNAICRNSFDAFETQVGLGIVR